LLPQQQMLLLLKWLWRLPEHLWRLPGLFLVEGFNHRQSAVVELRVGYYRVVRR